ncbi:hypothetical protein [Streptosporangium sp. CA-115845]|uniref:hypothetical protein n=1 Tax=Streptosporangium sp. CA-115845 TaxID=3240071 RepID=UPI003D90CEBC
MNEVLSLDAPRTPFGRNRGGLSGVRVDKPAAHPPTTTVGRRTVDPAFPAEWTEPRGHRAPRRRRTADHGMPPRISLEEITGQEMEPG